MHYPATPAYATRVARTLGGVIRIGAFSLGVLLAIGAHGQTTGRIVIDGSTGGMPLAAALVKAFQERNPGVTVEIGKGLGTKARILALAEGKIDIALASHGLNISEITRQGMAVHEIANVPVVFGVDPSAQNVERKAYRLVRESFFVTNTPAPPAVARFLEFTRSAMGYTVITADGAIAAK